MNKVYLVVSKVSKYSEQSETIKIFAREEDANVFCFEKNVEQFKRDSAEYGRPFDEYTPEEYSTMIIEEKDSEFLPPYYYNYYEWEVD